MDAGSLENFRRIRIPRVHAVQRISFANAHFKHLRGAERQKALIASARHGTHGNVEFLWGHDPVGDGDRRIRDEQPTLHGFTRAIACGTVVPTGRKPK
jgi:hypothetical protein